MALRVQLINNKFGSLLIERNDPIDINSITKKVLRSDKDDGIVFEIMLDLEFIKEARRYLKLCFEQDGGIDAQVNVNVYDYHPNLRKWIVYYTGQVNYSDRGVSEDRLTVTLEQVGFQRQLINAFNVDVDLETLVSENGTVLPESPLIEVDLHSKTIVRTFEASNLSEEAEYNNIDALAPGQIRTVYYIPNTQVSSHDEIEVRASYNGFLTDREPTADQLFMFKLKEAGNYQINIEETFKFQGIFMLSTAGSGHVSYVVQWYIVIGVPGFYIQSTIGGPYTVDGFFDNTRAEIIGEGVFDNDFDLPVGYEIYIYAKVDILNASVATTFSTFDVLFRGNNPVDENPLHVKIVAKTTFPASKTKGMLLYEAFLKMVQFHTNQIDCFRSDILGRIDLDYPEDGSASQILLTSGNFIRNKTVNQDEEQPKKFFSNLDSLLKFVDMKECIGRGFEKGSSGQTLFRIDKKERFYDKNTLITSLGKVYDPKSKVDYKRYFNQMEIGYPGKLNIKAINAIDEFNTIRRFRMPIKNTKHVLKIVTDLHAQGYLIESMRRLIGSTEDSNYDDDNFVISVIKDDYTYRSKTNDGYSLIENVFDPATGYNYDLSPARCAENWQKIMASNGIYAGFKITSFNYGEINYEMITQKDTETVPLAENGNFDLTNIFPIWENEIYTVDEVPFSRDQMALVTANPYGYIDFEDQFGIRFEGFINMVEHDPNKKQANFELLKVYRSLLEPISS